jgi:hypothetical protein
VTEEQWLACTDLDLMLRCVLGRVSHRKLRLFCAACCRHIWHLLTDERGLSAVSLAEAYADGLTD